MGTLEYLLGTSGGLVRTSSGNMAKPRNTVSNMARYTSFPRAKARSISRCPDTIRGSPDRGSRIADRGYSHVLVYMYMTKHTGIYKLISWWSPLCPRFLTPQLRRPFPKAVLVGQIKLFVLG